MNSPSSKADLLVAVAAHADDAELNAGGLMAKWHARGGSVAIVMVSNNCSGGFLPEDGDESRLLRLPPEETTARRHAEQEMAAAMLSAKVHYLGYPQRHFWNGKETVLIGYERGGDPVPQHLLDLPPLLLAFRQPEHVRRLADLLASLAPRRVVTQISTDLDQEHLAVCAMTCQAFRLEEKRLADTQLQFWTPGSSAPQGLFDPGYDHIEDISDFYEAKLALCGAHRSQMTRERWRMVESHARHWGQKIGVEYAEPYKTANPDWDKL
jgi:LmbE family N-acetylglucosaminyl deacetylase